MQRQIILSALQKLKTHPTIDELYAEIYMEHPSISKSTVYRNLRRLAADGLVRNISLPDGLERYDGTIRQHYHFRCNECHCIIDVDVEHSMAMSDQVQEKYGFKAVNHDVVFTGFCRNC